MTVRSDFLSSFEQALAPVGLLDSFKVAGAVASWWGDVQFDLKTLMARGFRGTIDGWVTTITTAMDEDGGKFDPLDHKLVKRILAEFLDEIAETEGLVAELDGQLKSTERSADDDEDGAGEDEEVLSEADKKALKTRLTAAKKTLKQLKAALADRLTKANSALTDDGARELVLNLLKADLKAVLDRAVNAHRQQVVAAVENWWDKYRVTLRDIEKERDDAKTRLDGFLKELGYV